MPPTLREPIELSKIELHKHFFAEIFSDVRYEK